MRCGTHGGPAAEVSHRLRQARGDVQLRAPRVGAMGPTVRRRLARLLGVRQHRQTDLRPGERHPPG